MNKLLLLIDGDFFPESFIQKITSKQQNNSHIEIIFSPDYLSLQTTQKKYLIFCHNDDSYNYLTKIFSESNQPTPIFNYHDNLDMLDHNIEHIIKYYSSNSELLTVPTNDMELAIKIIDNHRIKYCYHNEWLYNANSKILSFILNNTKYIAKRTTKDKCLLEIKNSKLLKDILNHQKFDNYTINIVIPEMYPGNHGEYYLVSPWFGQDLNTLYYKHTNHEKYHRLFDYINKLLLQNGILYNGLLPRNVIVNNSDIYLIDFEDINKKDLRTMMTTQAIAWSYFGTEKLTTDELSYLNSEKYYSQNSQLNNLLSEYPSFYQIALEAEQKNDNFKMDDIINIISNHISFDLEILLDLILFEINNHNFRFNFKNMLYSLSEEIKLTPSEIIDNEKISIQIIQIIIMYKDYFSTNIRSYIETVYCSNEKTNIYLKSLKKGKAE